MLQNYLTPQAYEQLRIDRLKRLAARRAVVAPAMPHLSLSQFTRAAWHVVEPATPYIPNWHIDAISEHLEAVTQGQIRNLIINIPPRHMKSLAVSVFWPTWVWSWRPSSRWLFASYAEALAIRDSLKCRRLIQSPWYQRRYGALFRLTSDQNQKARFENDQTGYRMATGVEGMATGEGGDFVVVDDPGKVQEAESEASRQSVLDWWDQTMSTRLNDPKTGAKVIVMQRVHERDLTGHLLERMREGGEHYEHLCLPAEYEPKRYLPTSIGFSDPRRAPGELLWPAHFDQAAVDNLKASLGESGAAGQLQQRPAPAGGAEFKREWWEGKNRYDAADQGLGASCLARWLSFDTALKDKSTSDYTAATVFELTRDYRLVVRRVWRDRLRFPSLVSTIEAMARAANVDDKLRGIIIEDKGSGISAGQTLGAGADLAFASLIVAFAPPGDKVYRGRLASVWCERDCVLLPHPSDEAPWLFDFEQELFNFPAAAHDDQVDSFTQGVLYLENYLAAGYQARHGRDT